MFFNHYQEEFDTVVLEDVAVDEGTGNTAELIVYNDDHNTFDWVIQCLMEILEHTPEQAEQLSLIVHFKGKATVKTGPKPELLPKRQALVERGLSATIESISKDD